MIIVLMSNLHEHILYIYMSGGFSLTKELLWSEGTVSNIRDRKNRKYKRRYLVRFIAAETQAGVKVKKLNKVHFPKIE